MTQTQERSLTTVGPQTMLDTQERDRLLRNLILPKASPEQFSLVLAICQRYGFDPLLRHVLIVGGNLYVTRDGLRHMAWQSGEFDGYDPPEERKGDDGKWIVTVKVWRKGISRPFVATAYQGEAENPQSPVWRSHPRLMTGKVAEVIALRMAFGVSLSGAEEIGFDDQVPQTNIGEARFVEQRVREVPPAQVAAPRQDIPLPAQALPQAEFGAFMRDFNQMAADGHSTGALVGAMKAKAPVLDADQRKAVRTTYDLIIEARKAGEAWPAPEPETPRAESAPIEAHATETTPARMVPVGDEWADVVGEPAQPVEVTPLGNGAAKATERQVKFIIAIGQEAGFDKAGVEEQAQLLYGCAVDALNRKQAADLIEKLQLRRGENAMDGKPAGYAG